jgi:hypothetical protein
MKSTTSATPASDRFQFSLRTMLIVVTVVAVLLTVLIVLARLPLSAAQAARCQSNLKQFGLALHNYLAAEGTFPPAYIADSHGRPMHSWRMLILPYFEMGSDAEEIYKEYDFSEPWDGPNNRRLIERMPRIFRCPKDERAPPGTTSYFAVVGGQSAWPFDVGRPATEFADGLSNTILVVEATGRAIPWTEPRDLDFDQLDFTINGPTEYGIASTHTGGVMTLMSDGDVRFLPEDIRPAILRALLTVGGGEPVSPP